MSAPAQPTRKHSPQGFVLIFLLLALALASLTLLGKNLWSSDPLTQQKKQTQAALMQAKLAILAYVEVGSAEDLGLTNLLKKNNGRLPCPDQDGDGIAISAVENPCGLIGAPSLFGAGYHSLGLLPWKQLGLPPIRDSTHECLWLAVDGKFKLNSATSPVNSDSMGSFSVIQPVKNRLTGAWTETLLAGNPLSTATTDANRVVAVIMAPGTPTQGQSRLADSGGSAIPQQPCTLTTLWAGVPNAQRSAANYLESYTSASLSGMSGSNNLLTSIPNKEPLPTPHNQALQTFVQADVGQEKLNDQLIWITAHEFSKAVTKRAARIMANYINTYVAANGKYPPAAATVGGACVTSPQPLLQGYVPYACAGLTGAGDMTMASGTDRLYGDPDRWYGQTHYAVSETCITGATAGAPCGGVARVNVGKGPAVPAIMLLRGRALTTVQVCAPTEFGAAANIAGCLEGANAAVVSAAWLAPLKGSSGISGAQYAIPETNLSNDYMIRFDAK